MNGFADSAQYRKKNRIRTISVNGVNVNLRDTPYVQELSLKRSVTGKKIIFKIVDVYKGDLGDDTCISELSFRKINVQPKKTVVIPFSISKGGYKFTLEEEGKLNAEGTGSEDCPALFVKGDWTKKASGNFLLKYVVKSGKLCGDIRKIKRRRDLDYNRMKTVLTVKQIKKSIKF